MPMLQLLHIYIYIHMYHSWHTHLIGERTTEHLPHLFYTLASDDRLWFQLRGQITLRILFLLGMFQHIPRTFDCGIVLGM